VNDPIDEAEEAEVQDPEPTRRRRDGDADDEDGSRKRLIFLISLVAATAAIVGMVFVLLESKGTYSKPVDELVADQARYVGRPVRAEGVLVHGSLAKGADGCDHRFTITKGGARIPVHYPQCVIPDSLRDVEGIDVEVNVEGELLADGSLGATRVFTKCPSKYDEKKLVALGAKAPH